MHWYGTIFVLGGALLLLCCSALLLIHFLLIVIRVQGASMSPTIEDGDRVLALRLLWARWVRKGQVVLFKQTLFANAADDSPLSLHIKRVVALAGEKFLSSSTPIGYNEHFTQKEQHYTWHIPPDHIFVCGDNREQSIDSRNWGPLPLRNVRGIVVKRLSPSPTFPSAHVDIAPKEDI